MISIDVNKVSKSAKVNRDSSNAQMELDPEYGKYAYAQKFGVKDIP